jgi:hypothetical protein
MPEAPYIVISEAEPPGLDPAAAVWLKESDAKIYECAAFDGLSGARLVREWTLADKLDAPKFSEYCKRLDWRAEALANTDDGFKNGASFDCGLQGQKRYVRNPMASRVQFPGLYAGGPVSVEKVFKQNGGFLWLLRQSLARVRDLRTGGANAAGQGFVEIMNSTRPRSQVRRENTVKWDSATSALASNTRLVCELEWRFFTYESREPWLAASSAALDDVINFAVSEYAGQGSFGAERKWKAAPSWRLDAETNAVVLLLSAEEVREGGMQDLFTSRENCVSATDTVFYKDAEAGQFPEAGLRLAAGAEGACKVSAPGESPSWLRTDGWKAVRVEVSRRENGRGLGLFDGQAAMEYAYSCEFSYSHPERRRAGEDSTDVSTTVYMNQTAAQKEAAQKGIEALVDPPGDTVKRTTASADWRMNEFCLFDGTITIRALPLPAISTVSRTKDSNWKETEMLSVSEKAAWVNTGSEASPAERIVVARQYSMRVAEYKVFGDDGSANDFAAAGEAGGRSFRSGDKFVGVKYSKPTYGFEGGTDPTQWEDATPAIFAGGSAP